MDALQISISDQPDEPCIAQCMAVMASAFDSRYGEAWTAPQLRSMLTLPGSILVTGAIGEQIIGFGLLRAIAGEAELLLLAVDPAHRGAGHGTRILDRCLIAAETNGAQTVFLEVREGNQAVHLYAKAGFTQYSRRRDYYLGADGTRYDAMSLRAVLLSN